MWAFSSHRNQKYKRQVGGTINPQALTKFNGKGVIVFPLHYPTANEAISDLTSIIEWNKLLHAKDKEAIGYGYELIEKEINYLLGRNIIPTHSYS